MIEGEVLRFDLTRKDIEPSVKGTAVLPALVAHGYAAFLQVDEGAGGGGMEGEPGAGNRCLAAGEVVLLEEEVDPYLAALGTDERLFESTGLHNHHIQESPRLIFHHWVAEGSCEQIARTLVDATRTTAQTLGDPEPMEVPGLDTEAIDEILGGESKDMEGVHEVSIPKETIQNGLTGEDRNTFPPAMGPESVIVYQQMEENRVAIATELAFLPEEAGRAVARLQQYGWMVAAQHNHFLNDEPRLIFVHAMAMGDAIERTRELQLVLEGGTPGPGPGEPGGPDEPGGPAPGGPIE